jgi:hypothetical protein
MCRPPMCRPPLARFAALVCLLTLVTCTSVGHAQKKDSLIGTRWTGRETLAGFGSLTFEFEQGGNVTMIDAKETVPGRYTRRGASVTLSFFNGQAVYTGQISGKKMSGTARSAAAGTWKWQVSIERDDPPPAPPPPPPIKPKLKKTVETPVHPAPAPMTSPAAVPAPPKATLEMETKAAAFLTQAKDTLKTGNTSLARVRLNLVVTEYDATRAAVEARQLLNDLAK